MKIKIKVIFAGDSLLTVFLKILLKQQCSSHIFQIISQLAFLFLEQTYLRKMMLSVNIREPFTTKMKLFF